MIPRGRFRRRFNAGVACDAADEGSIVGALKAGLRMVRFAPRSASTQGLVEFHRVEDFASTALASVLGDEVYRTLGRPLEWRHSYGDRRRPQPRQGFAGAPAWSGSQWDTLA